MSTEVEQLQQPHLERTSSKPKGILKHVPVRTPSSGPHNLTWDEENLALTEIQKDSLMKITEPKTPYVRYNALTDEVEGFSNVPSFDLDSRSRSPPTLPSPIGSPPAAQTEFPQASVRRTSFTGPRPGSRSSSRSASFNVREVQEVENNPTTGNGEIETEEMDEESQKRHDAFVRARGRHYSNEAEAMKRAQELMAQDEDEEGTTEHETDKNSDMLENESEESHTTADHAPQANGVPNSTT